MKNIVVVGGGHAAAQFCASIAASSHMFHVTLVTEEDCLPYQRPPLSKTWLKEADPQPAWLRPAKFYSDHGVEVLFGTRATALDPDRHTVLLSTGSELTYDYLVLATGTSARELPLFKHKPENVFTLRTLTDARNLRARMQDSRDVVVFGGGFIGLEVAATAASLGKRVTLLEAGDRLLGRSVSPEVSDWLLYAHRASGIKIELGSLATDFTTDDANLNGVKVHERFFPSDLVVVGIGAVPNIELAQSVGLHCDNGIVVNEFMQTSNPDIYAIGDCVSFQSAELGRFVRLESVQNANDQARCAAASILNCPVSYQALPWFWSDQGAIRIQIVGIPEAHHDRLLRGDPDGGKFSVLYFDGDRLTCVESINSPPDHMVARRLIAAKTSIDRKKAADPSVALRTFEVN